MDISATAKRDFLTLLVAHFAVIALFTVLSFFRELSILPQFNITINGLERSITTFAVSVIQIALSLLIFIRMMTRKDFGLSSKSKAGLVLMMVCLFLYPVYDAIVILTSGVDIVKWFPICSLVYVILSIISIFMFINGAPVEKKLRRFVKWTPFIPIIFTVPAAILSEIFQNHAFVDFVCGKPYNTAMNFLILLWVFRLARKEYESYTDTPETEETDTTSSPQ